MNIQIKEPCHENWQAMTPTQQGAFCGSCQKEVVDFSKKSINQIKSFFAEKSHEKICGRFQQKQLTYLSFDDFFNAFKYWNFSKKIALVFFFSLGLVSFNSYAQTNAPLKGKVAVSQQHLQGEPAITHLTGDVAYQPNDSTKNTVKGNIKCNKPIETKKEKNIPVMGMMTPINSAPKKKK